MSLENLISGLTAALQANTAALQAQAGAPAVVPQAQTQQAPPPFNPAAQQAYGAPAGMPGAPFGGAAPQAFGAPPMQQAAPTLPFADLNGLVAYATDAYAILEKKQPGRGAYLQQVVNSLGVQQANQIPTEQYPQFFAAVEQLKAQP